MSSILDPKYVFLQRHGDKVNYGKVDDKNISNPHLTELGIEQTIDFAKKIVDSIKNDPKIPDNVRNQPLYLCTSYYLRCTQMAYILAKFLKDHGIKIYNDTIYLSTMVHEKRIDYCLPSANKTQKEEFEDWRQNKKIIEKKDFYASQDFTINWDVCDIQEDYPDEIMELETMPEVTKRYRQFYKTLSGKETQNGYSGQLFYFGGHGTQQTQTKQIWYEDHDCEEHYVKVVAKNCEYSIVKLDQNCTYEYIRIGNPHDTWEEHFKNFSKD